MRLNPYPIIYPYTDKASLIIQKGMTGATGNYYCGLHEYEDMAFLLHFLREDDVFVDIGANIGSYTVLASGHIGATTYAFEPAPSTYKHLINNIAINQISGRVKAYNLALGSQQGSVNFTSSLDTVNHIANIGETDTIQVTVEKLDDILENQKQPSLLKIDVEGFETEVLRGASRTLNQQCLKAIIIELNGSGGRYKFDEREIHRALLNLNFHAFSYDPAARILNPRDTYGIHNTIYVRDVNRVKERLVNAPKVKILGKEI